MVVSSQEQCGCCVTLHPTNILLGSKEPAACAQGFPYTHTLHIKVFFYQKVALRIFNWRLPNGFHHKLNSLVLTHMKQPESSQVWKIVIKVFFFLQTKIFVITSGLQWYTLLVFLITIVHSLFKSSQWRVCSRNYNNVIMRGKNDIIVSNYNVEIMHYGKDQRYVKRFLQN